MHRGIITAAALLFAVDAIAELLRRRGDWTIRGQAQRRGRAETDINSQLYGSAVLKW